MTAVVARRRPALPRVTREEAIRRAGRILAEARRRRDALSVEDAARAAYCPGLGGPSIPELEAKIRRMRAEDAAAAGAHERRAS